MCITSPSNSLYLHGRDSSEFITQTDYVAKWSRFRWRMWGKLNAPLMSCAMQSIRYVLHFPLSSHFTRHSYKRRRFSCCCICFGWLSQKISFAARFVDHGHIEAKQNSTVAALCKSNNTRCSARRWVRQTCTWFLWFFPRRSTDINKIRILWGLADPCDEIVHRCVAHIRRWYLSQSRSTGTIVRRKCFLKFLIWSPRCPRWMESHINFVRQIFSFATCRMIS